MKQKFVYKQNQKLCALGFNYIFADFLETPHRVKTNDKVVLGYSSDEGKIARATTGPSPYIYAFGVNLVPYRRNNFYRLNLLID